MFTLKTPRKLFGLDQVPGSVSGSSLFLDVKHTKDHAKEILRTADPTGRAHLPEGSGPLPTTSVLTYNLDNVPPLYAKVVKSQLNLKDMRDGP